MVAIVLLPGMHGNAELFGDFVSALGSEMVSSILTFPAERPLGYDALAEFCRDYLPQNEPYILLGESFSGPVAISLAADRPPGLLGLVLCGTFAVNPYPLLKPFKCLVNLLPVGPSVYWLGERWMLGRFATERWKAAFRHALSLTSKEVLRERIRAVLDVDYREKLKKIQVPVLYLQALRDWVVPASPMREISAALPNMRVQRFDAPHMILQIVPQEAAQAVEKFATDCLSVLRENEPK